jgi:hypothetical protein
VLQIETEVEKDAQAIFENALRINKVWSNGNFIWWSMLSSHVPIFVYHIYKYKHVVCMYSHDDTQICYCLSLFEDFFRSNSIEIKRNYVILPLLNGSQKLKGKIWSLLCSVHLILRITEFLDFIHRLISGKNTVLGY